MESEPVDPNEDRTALALAIADACDRDLEIRRVRPRYDPTTLEGSDRLAWALLELNDRAGELKGDLASRTDGLAKACEEIEALTAAVLFQGNTLQEVRAALAGPRPDLERVIATIDAAIDVGTGDSNFDKQVRALAESHRRRDIDAEFCWHPIVWLDEPNCTRAAIRRELIVWLDKDGVYGPRGAWVFGHTECDPEPGVLSTTRTPVPTWLATWLDEQRRQRRQS